MFHQSTKTEENKTEETKTEQKFQQLVNTVKEIISTEITSLNSIIAAQKIFVEFHSDCTTYFNSTK